MQVGEAGCGPVSDEVMLASGVALYMVGSDGGHRRWLGGVIYVRPRGRRAGDTPAVCFCFALCVTLNGGSLPSSFTK